MNVNPNKFKEKIIAKRNQLNEILAYGSDIEKKHPNQPNWESVYNLFAKDSKELEKTK